MSLKPTILAKLLLGFLVVSLIGMVMGAMGIRYVNSLSMSSDSMLRDAAAP